LRWLKQSDIPEGTGELFSLGREVNELKWLKQCDIPEGTGELFSLG
jgi:hypothetical protein